MRDIKIKEAKALFKSAILLEWPTGFGKTLASLDIIGTDKRIVVLCQELLHIENWKSELDKHNLNLDIEFYTYASMHLIKDYENYNLILDECHWCTSDLRISILKLLKYDKIVLLSASLEVDDTQKFKSTIKDLVIHRISLQDAIDNDVLVEPSIEVLEIQLDNSVKQCLHIVSKGKNGKIHTCQFKDYWTVYNSLKTEKSFIIICACTQMQKYKLMISEADALKKKAYTNEVFWKLYQYKLNNIKRWIIEVKTYYATELFNKLTDRLICFAGSIDQAKQINPISIHSENSSKTNKKILEEFNNKSTNKLVTVKMIRESANLTDIETGIIVQIDNKKKSPIQMIGRILRSKTPKVYLLCIIDTIDDKYIRTQLTVNHIRRRWQM